MPRPKGTMVSGVAADSANSRLVLRGTVPGLLPAPLLPTNCQLACRSPRAASYRGVDARGKRSDTVPQSQ